ncbi:hypothetical protein QBC39DRAFT_328150 [Podospora conica]|nr:hypothetical protein QBC39DRAFT_328150 [Schizothecium conicum]
MPQIDNQQIDEAKYQNLPILTARNWAGRECQAPSRHAAEEMLNKREKAWSRQDGDVDVNVDVEDALEPEMVEDGDASGRKLERWRERAFSLNRHRAARWGPGQQGGCGQEPQIPRFPFRSLHLHHMKVLAGALWPMDTVGKGKNCPFQRRNCAIHGQFVDSTPNTQSTMVACRRTISRYARPSWGTKVPASQRVCLPHRLHLSSHRPSQNIGNRDSQLGASPPKIERRCAGFAPISDGLESFSKHHLQFALASLCFPPPSPPSEQSVGF